MLAMINDRDQDGVGYNACMNRDPLAEQPVDAPGTLYVLATPIGNLEDLSERAARILREVDLIAAEDTRVTARLAARAGDLPRMLSLNDHNEQRRVEELIRLLRAGASLALVSDAGTPLVSDPGYRLVQAAHDNGVPVSPVPGPCAAIAALSVAGLPSDRFHFEGFLPPRQAARRRRLGELAECADTLIFYVPARDLPEVLGDLAAMLGENRLATLGRELTKRHETILRQALGELAGRVRDDPDQQRGEAVLIVAGSAQARPAIALERLAAELGAALPPSRAAGILARLTHLDRRQAFALIESARSGGAGHPEPGDVDEI